MKARAPGKVVLSGAYAVLEGAPAIVTAVSRYVLADTSRPADLVTEEVRAAGLASAPWFDAGELRANSRKLGLGSSAAILVASLAAHALERNLGLDDESLAAMIFPQALVAHRLAQPYGSGIDVCSSCFGGHRLVLREGASLHHEAISLPSGLHLQIWAAPSSCSTGSMLEALGEYRVRSPGAYDRCIREQHEASERAAKAVVAEDASRLVMALVEQRLALQSLGHGAGVPIVTNEVAALADAAASEAAAVLPAGAGGGDVAVYAALHPPSERLKHLAAALHHEVLSINLGVRGVHSAAMEC